MKRFVVLALFFLGLSCLIGEPAFSIVPKGKGHFQIMHRGKVLFEDTLPVVRDDGVQPKLQEKFQKLTDGTSVWNVWNDDFETRFRMETAISADGSRIEISFLGEAPADTKHRQRMLYLRGSYKNFAGMKYHGYIGHARSNAKERSGVLAADLADGYLHDDIWRWLELDDGSGHPILFDLDTYGPTNPCPFHSHN